MSKNLQVVQTENLSLSKPQPAMDIEALFRLAIEKGGAVETIERMMVIRRELNAESAKAEFDSAMAAFQSECPVILKKKAGAKGAYNYAPLDHIVAQTKDLIRKHGFSFGVTTEIKPGWLKAVCTVTHERGHSKPSEFEVPIDNKNPMMTDPQRYGGAMTFAKRYAFCNAFGILCSDDDLDGNLSRPKPAGPSSVAPSDLSLKEYASKLWTLMKPVRGVLQNWDEANQFLWDNTLIDDNERAPDFTAARFKEVIEKVERKLSK